MDGIGRVWGIDWSGKGRDEVCELGLEYAVSTGMYYEDPITLIRSSQEQRLCWNVYLLVHKDQDHRAQGCHWIIFHMGLTLNAWVYMQDAPSSNYATAARKGQHASVLTQEAQ